MIKSKTKEPILRRMSLFYTEKGHKVNLLTVVEQIEPDMPDYDYSPNEEVSCREGGFAIEVTDYKCAEGWMDDLKKWKSEIGDNNAYKRQSKTGEHLVLSREFDKSKLTELLPYRRGPHYVVIYAPDAPKDKLNLNDENLRQQLSSITEKQLGYDILNHQDRLGSIIMVWHHPVIKDIHFTATDNPAGMLCTMFARKAESLPLRFIVTDHDKDGNQIGEPIEIRADIEEGKCLLRTELPVTRPDIEVWDENGNLVFAIRRIIFIKTIVLNMGVMDVTTGKTEAATEKGVITRVGNKKATEQDKQRDGIAKEIAGLLKGLPYEEQELIMEDVKRRMEA